MFLVSEADYIYTDHTAVKCVFPTMVWGSRHWRGEGQAKSAVARSAPTGVLAIGRGSGRRGSALTRADDDGFDRGGKYEL